MVRENVVGTHTVIEPGGGDDVTLPPDQLASSSFSSVLIVDCEVGTVVVVLHAVAEIPLAWEPDTLMVQYGVVPNP